MNFDTKTAKRVAWSEWEFTIVGPFEIEVCNASYGFKKRDHVYRVMIDEQGEPVSCTCKGFKHYHGPNDRVGKHMLAVAAVGGPTVLNAAVDFDPAPAPVKADGGCECDGHEFPCFECYRSGRRELP
ncbi:SWIM family zinc finger [Halapricum desulfuricans]|uniref:SWIM family zinc finger n=1 Tax=Halapricum desulfuricans TaxID=2841257 RepID=A0A897NK36_9EURY|nr:SWIM family zinc finger [Halapricum desulfuricans]